MKGVLIIIIFLIFKFIITKNDHFVTIYFQNIQSHTLEILVFCLLIKMIENQIGEESGLMNIFRKIQLIITLILKFGFLIYLLKNFLILKIRNHKFFQRLMEKCFVRKEISNLINRKSYRKTFFIFIS